MKKVLRIILFLAMLVFIGTGIYVFGQSRSEKQGLSEGLQVTASFYPMYYFASEIGGNHANVKNITPPGVEPHDFEPSAQDIARIETSDLLILNGGVEAWADKIKNNLNGKKVTIVIAGEGLLTQQMEEEGETIRDPHVWLSPLLAKNEVSKIAQAFIAKDPSNSSFYEANEKSLQSRLDALDTLYKQGLNTCQKKDIITSHAAFGYLADAYGLRQVPISGISPDEEPSTQQLVKVAAFAKANNVKYIFFESLLSPKLSETIAKEIGAQTLVLDPLEGISDDDIKQGENYFTVMEDNLKNLQIALECKK